MNELIDELKFAMKSNPDLNIIDIINLAVDLKHPSRIKDEPHYIKNTTESYKMTNKTILESLKLYNRQRKY